MGESFTEDGDSSSSRKRERIIPIRILKSPHAMNNISSIEEDSESILENDPSLSSKRHSLSVELEDGTFTETLGTSFPLRSSEEVHTETRHVMEQSVLIEEIERVPLTEPIIFLEEEEDANAKTIIEENEEVEKTSSFSSQQPKEEVVRLVPISLPNGRLLEGKVEECSVPMQRPSSSASSDKEEEPSYQHPEIVFPPDFGGDIPKWDSFPEAKDVLPGNGDEKVIPIVLEKSSKQSKACEDPPPRTSREIIITNKDDKEVGESSRTKPTVRFNVSEKRDSNEREIHQIDEDIHKIWKELQELDSEPRPGSSVSSWPRNNNPPPRYPKQSPVTAHRVSTSSISESPKYTPIRDSSLTRPGTIPKKTASSTNTPRISNTSNPFLDDSESKYTAPNSDSLPRKSSMTVVTSSYKPMPSFAKPLTIKGGVVKPAESEDPPEEEIQKAPVTFIPTRSSSLSSSLDKETQTCRDIGRKENCALM